MFFKVALRRAGVRSFSTFEHLMSFNRKKQLIPVDFTLGTLTDINPVKTAIFSRCTEKGIVVIRFESECRFEHIPMIISSLSGSVTTQDHQRTTDGSGVVRIVSTSSSNNHGLSLHTDGGNLNVLVEKRGQISQLIQRAQPHAFFMHTQPAASGGDFFVADGNEIVSRIIEEKPHLLSWLLSPLPERMVLHNEVLSRFPLLSPLNANRWMLTMLHNPRQLFECTSECRQDRQYFFELFSIINECLQLVKSQKNLVILLNNHRMLHGRMPIDSGVREILGAGIEIKSLESGISLAPDLQQGLLNYLRDRNDDSLTDLLGLVALSPTDQQRFRRA